MFSCLKLSRNIYLVCSIVSSNVTTYLNGSSYHKALKRSYGQFPPRKPFLPKNINQALHFVESANVGTHVLDTLKKMYFKTEKRFMELRKKERRKRFPLIVLEGLDGCGKSAVAQRVAYNIKGEYRVSPSKALADIRASFEDAPLTIRASFYTIGNHIVAMELFPALSKRTVILDRFWYSTSAFAIAQAAFTDVFFRMPDKGDKIFKWPCDLLKPDLVMFLHLTEENRTQRHCSRGTSNTQQEQLLASSDRFRNNVFTAYDRMYDPAIIKIDANPPLEVVVASVEGKVRPVVDAYKLKLKDDRYSEEDDDDDER